MLVQVCAPLGAPIHVHLSVELLSPEEPRVLKDKGRDGLDLCDFWAKGASSWRPDTFWRRSPQLAGR